MFFITIVSLAVATALSIALWQALRREQERSSARVAALADAIHPADETPFRTEDDLRGSPVAVASLFDTGRRSAMQGRPLLKIGIGFTMAVAVIIVAAMMGDRHESTAAVPAEPAAAVTRSDSLELLSMRHSREGDTLIVTGLVRNPTAQAATPLTAVVFAFDHTGSFVASGRAPLEFARLGPGDESPFQVTIPHVNDVGRYRVTFRNDAGVVRHVDKRPDIAAALTR